MLVPNHYHQKNPTLSQSQQNKVGRDTLFSWTVHLICLVGRFRELSKQRRELAQLTDEQLNDIGLTREMADREANKPFWVE